METESLYIAVDFDGTCVTHDFPHIGKDIGAVPVLRELVANGHKIILWTMRSNNQTNYPKALEDAVWWFQENNIPLFGVNQNPTQKEWTESPKAYANIYIDDLAIGCPLIHNKEIHHLPFVDWHEVSQRLISIGAIK
jgi:hypothetical protein